MVQFETGSAGEGLYQLVRVTPEIVRYGFVWWLHDAFLDMNPLGSSPCTPTAPAYRPRPAKIPSVPRIYACQARTIGAKYHPARTAYRVDGGCGEFFAGGVSP